MQAEELSTLVGEEFVALLLATKAEIAIGLGDYEQAEHCLTEELGLYRSISPIDAALVSVDLLRTQLRRGRMVSALETIKGMSALLGSLKDNEDASKAIMRLIRLALAGEGITYGILDQVKREIEKERARRGRRAHGKS